MCKYYVSLFSKYFDCNNLIIMFTFLPNGTVHHPSVPLLMTCKLVCECSSCVLHIRRSWLQLDQMYFVMYFRNKAIQFKPFNSIQFNSIIYTGYNKNRICFMLHRSIQATDSLSRPVPGGGGSDDPPPPPRPPTPPPPTHTHI